MSMLSNVCHVTPQIPDTCRRQAELTREAADLRVQAALLNKPDTFHQCAKAERRAIALEKEVEKMKKYELYIKGSFLYRAPAIAKNMLFLAVLAIAFLKRPTVATIVDGDAVWPLQNWLKMSADTTIVGTVAIGLVPWYVLSQRVTAACLRTRS